VVVAVFRLTDVQDASREQPGYWDEQYGLERAPEITPSPTEGLLKDLVGRSFPDRLVEMGCGPGRLAALLDGGCVHYLGVDISDYAITSARQAHPGLRFEVGDALTWQPKKPVDVIVAVELLSSIEQQSAEVFDHWRGFLAEDGRIVIVERRGALVLTA
jgi:trans-aconitate methyltransferase